MYVCVIGTCLDDVSLRAIKRKAMLRIFVDRFEIQSGRKRCNGYDNGLIPGV